MQELESASRRAKLLWGRDAATIDEERRSRRGSLGSAYAGTVIGPSSSTMNTASRLGNTECHDLRCDVCRKVSSLVALYGASINCMPGDRGGALPVCDVPVKASTL